MMLLPKLQFATRQQDLRVVAGEPGLIRQLVLFDLLGERALFFVELTQARIKKDKEVAGTISLDGFNDQPIVINPLELPESGKLSFTLKKPPKGTPVQRIRDPEKKDPNNGASTPPPVRDPTNGELTGDPYAGSGGTVPKSK